MPLLRSNALEEHALVDSAVVRFQEATLSLAALFDVTTEIAFLRIVEVRSKSTRNLESSPGSRVASIQKRPVCGLASFEGVSMRLIAAFNDVSRAAANHV